MRGSVNAKGGIATLVHIDWKVLDFVIHSLYVLLVVSDEFGTIKIIVNAYLPPNGSEYAPGKYSDMLETLEEGINRIIMKLNLNAAVLVCGDFNCRIGKS
jgi:exonuclease III